MLALYREPGTPLKRESVPIAPRPQCSRKPRCDPKRRKIRGLISELWIRLAVEVDLVALTVIFQFMKARTFLERPGHETGEMALSVPG
jgi:hypothetical protein